MWGGSRRLTDRGTGQRHGLVSHRSSTGEEDVLKCASLQVLVLLLPS